MIRTILAATDGSAPAERAVAVAAEIAGKMDARLVLAHVMSAQLVNDDVLQLAEVEHMAERKTTTHPNLAGVPSWMTDAMISIARAQEAPGLLQSLAKQVLDRATITARKNGAEDIRRAVEENKPAEKILAIAEREGADLIAVGSRGLGTIREVVLGSVSRRIAQDAACPCLVVK